MTKQTKTPFVDSLLDSDIRIWLAAGLLVVCAIGGFFGVWAALKTVVGAFVVLLILAGPVLVWSRERTVASRFAELRERFGGEVSRNWQRFGRRRLTFSYREATVDAWLEYPARESFGPTLFHVELRGRLPQIEFEILPRGIQSFARRFLGRPRVSVTSRRFDADFEVFGDPPHHVNRRLTAHLQQHVRSLLPLGLQHVTMNHKGIDVVTHDESLTRVVEATLGIYDEVIAGGF